MVKIILYQTLFQFRYQGNWWIGEYDVQHDHHWERHADTNRWPPLCRKWTDQQCQRRYRLHGLSLPVEGRRRAPVQERWRCREWNDIPKRHCGWRSRAARGCDIDVERAAYEAVESVTRQTEPNGAVSATEIARSESKHATSDESISETGELGYITVGGVELKGNNSQSHSGSDDGLELDAISLDFASSADKGMRKRLALSMGSTRC